MPYQFNPLTGNFDIVNPQLTGADIKTLYEGEDNTNAFTDAEKSKLTGLDSANYATAEQGIKADNSVQLTGSQTVTGTKTFTSPLILPNNSRINGVEHFYQSTKPVTRGDGSVLVGGDKWVKIDDGTEWFWNGTYWVGERQTTGIIHNGSFALRFTSDSTADVTYCFGALGSPIFIHQLMTQYHVRNTNNSNNYWTVGATFGGFRLLESTLFPYTFNTQQNGFNITLVNRLNLNLMTTNIFDLRRGQVLRTGTPGELYVNYGLIYSDVLL